MQRNRFDRHKIIKKGQKVGLVAPCSPQVKGNENLVQQAIAILENWGLEVWLQPGHDYRHFYLAGNDEHRAEQFQDLYTNPEISALFVTRGGYGAARMLPHLDHSAIAQHSKPVVGLSDVTSLLLYLQHVCQMVVYHGPCLASSTFLHHPQRHQAHQSLYDCLFTTHYTPEISIKTLIPGRAQGLLTGGCLSLVVTSLGTFYEIDTVGKILFLEDVNEAPFRIDRMLTHLRNAGKLDQVQGVVFAEMVGCLGDDDWLWAILSDFFQHDSFPVVYGVPSGHGDYSLTLPLGRTVEIDTESNTIRFLTE